MQNTYASLEIDSGNHNELQEKLINSNPKGLPENINFSELFFIYRF
jgi:hypothetical protein